MEKFFVWADKLYWAVWDQKSWSGVDLDFHYFASWHVFRLSLESFIWNLEWNIFERYVISLHDLSFGIFGRYFRVTSSCHVLLAGEAHKWDSICSWYLLNQRWLKFRLGIFVSSSKTQENLLRFGNFQLLGTKNTPPKNYPKHPQNQFRWWWSMNDSPSLWHDVVSIWCVMLISSDPRIPAPYH